MVEPTGSGHILYVDDDESIRIAVSMALTDEGYEVQTAADGSAALALIASWQPDLILLDMRMPVMDGASFLQVYHQQPGPYARVIAVTAARNSPGDALPADINGILLKPFNLSELFNVVEQQLSPR